MSASPPSGNPVSASLLSRLKDETLHSFVATWDELEQLAVAAYRDQQQDAGRQARHRKLLGRLLDGYPQWEAALGAALRSLSTHSEQEPDAFNRILSATSLDVLQADWGLMRCFPQAREAINIYLLERLAQEEQDAP